MVGFVCFRVGSIVLVDPYTPLVVADCDHLITGLEGAEDIQQDIIADHHFLDEIDDLRERQTSKIRQPMLDALDYHLHSVLLHLRMVLHQLYEDLGVSDAASALLGTFIGGHTQPEPVLPEPLLRKLRHGVVGRLDDGERGLVSPANDF